MFAFSYSNDDISALVDISSNTFSAYSGDGVVVAGGYTDHTPAAFTDLHITLNVINAIGAGPERRHLGIGLTNTRGAGPEGIDAHTGGGTPGAIISGNTLTGTSTTNDSIGIWLRGPSADVQISGNPSPASTALSPRPFT